MTDLQTPDDWRALPDLAARALGGAVLAANDESFAEKESLIRPYPVVHHAHTFGHKGQLYDGWETRRRRDSATGNGGGHDWAIIRLGVPGTVHGIVVDTAYFTGNYPPQISVDACRLDGHPGLTDLLDTAWHPLVPVSDAKGDSVNEYAVHDTRRWTHVRLNMHPDGGIARLRVHVRPVPDPAAFADLPLDLAARLEGKSSLGRLGLLTHSTAGFIDPGFSGHVTLELSNVANLPITLWPGMKIGQLCVFQLTSPAEHPYGAGANFSRYQDQRGPTPSKSWMHWRTWPT